MRRLLAVLASGLSVMSALAACSTSSPPSTSPSSASSYSAGLPSASSSAPVAAETNAPGDIPDTQVFVPWSPSGGGFTVKVPEGWSRTTQGSGTVFTDKFNSVRIERVVTSTPPTVDSVRSTDIPQIQGGSTGFTLGKISTVRRKGGSAVLAEYRADSAPNQVTGKSISLNVQRYAFFKQGSEVVLTLSGAVGADNVDPWRIVTDSFGWS
jgi:hypothetical protein